LEDASTLIFQAFGLRGRLHPLLNRNPWNIKVLRLANHAHPAEIEHDVRLSELIAALKAIGEKIPRFGGSAGNRL